jgi:YD repeat-containing protein
MSRGYTHDAEANITAIGGEGGNTRYDYDTLYRLPRVDTEIPGLPQEHYSYDLLGNRITDARRPHPGQADRGWKYDENHRLLESATENTRLQTPNSQTITHAYDPDGSLIQTSTPAGTQILHPTDNQKYHYDARNRLTEVQDQNGNIIASYQYDPQGRRTRKTIHRTWDDSLSA